MLQSVELPCAIRSFPRSEGFLSIPPRKVLLGSQKRLSVERGVLVHLGVRVHRVDRNFVSTVTLSSS
jgi:hypothetical protein